MPWNIDVPADLPIVETSYSGNLTTAELLEAAQETLLAARAHGRFRLLADCTDLIGGHSFTDLYNLAESVAWSGEGHAIKEAVLLPRNAEAAERVEFWRVLCSNRGIWVQTFRERRSALDWLLES